MILAELTIRDYKQFAGEHAFEPDRQGITAVIGPNGAGKTTLFEAIEWCLYGPRSISNTDVLPRGVGGTPLVRITLEDACVWHFGACLLLGFETDSVVCRDGTWPRPLRR